jgi:hypothetical protein
MQGTNLTGDAGGAPQGTKLIKNIPTFKTEYWNIIGLKLLYLGFLQLSSDKKNLLRSPEQNQSPLYINELEKKDVLGGVTFSFCRHFFHASKLRKNFVIDANILLRASILYSQDT